MPETTVTNRAVSSLSVGTEMMSGDTTYQIGYPVTFDGETSGGYFPFSELEWPLDVVLGRIDGLAVFHDKWRLSGYFKMDLSDPDDEMKDSDWLTDLDPSRLDVYSESSIEDFSAFVINIDLSYIFVNKNGFVLYGGAGYQYQDFSFDGALITQYSPSGLPGFYFEGDGRVGITYDIEYSIPYLLLGTGFGVGDKFSFDASFAFSPFASAEDEDHHLMREFGGKISKSDMDGTALIFNASGKYNFTPRWFMLLGFQHTDIDVDGTMDQSYVETGYFLSNRVESESKQTSVYLSLGANF